MSSHVLRLFRDVCAPGARVALGDVDRVLYVLEGELVAAGTGGQHTVTAGSAYGVRPQAIQVGDAATTVLRYELLRDATPSDVAAADVQSTRLLEHPIALDGSEQYLMRADRVDFALGGVALPHGHRGGGIRCLIAGTLEITVGHAAPRLIRAGEAWFESGREPVLAKASAEQPTSFIRVAILPRAIRGQSSIVYVDPEDARRAPPRKYTVFVDEPIEI